MEAIGIAYNSAKAALNHFMRWVALQEAPRGVRVNCLSPGAIVTPALTAALDPNFKQSEEPEA